MVGGADGKGAVVAAVGAQANSGGFDDDIHDEVVANRPVGFGHGFGKECDFGGAVFVQDFFER